MSKKSNTMQISLPSRQQAFVLARATQCGFASVDEYLRELIRSDQTLARLDREIDCESPDYHVATRAEVEQKLAEALASGSPRVVDHGFWTAIRRSVAQRVRRRRNSRARRRARA